MCSCHVQLLTPLDVSAMHGTCLQEGCLRKHVDWAFDAGTNKLRQWFGRKGAQADASMLVAMRKKVLEQREKE